MNKNLIEGVDFYYLEKEGTTFKIFTEKYLSERGFCCKNNCKHCPYGFRDKFSDSMSEFKKMVKEQHEVLDKYITHYGKKKIFLEDESTYAWGKNPELISLFEGALKELIKDIHVTYKEKDASFFITIELK